VKPNLKPSFSSRGVALVLVLMALVLVTILILAFFSRALLTRQIAFSSINQVKADILGRSALDLALGEIREEIRTGSTSLNGGQSSYPIAYQPLATINFLPQPEGVSSPDAIGAATLLKVSANATPLNSNTGGRLLGSSISTGTSSLNGRELPSAAWFGAQGPQLGSQAALPTWVFLSRGNSVVPNPSYSAASSDLNYIVGRFAYAIYDIGGLLNASVAGYPSVDVGDAAYKSSLAAADLSLIPGFSTAGAVDSFMGWRQGSDAASAASYAAYVQNYGLANGFLSTKTGDNAFFSRRDLINLAQQGGYGLTPASLGYLTHFSYSVNAPSWTPANSPAVNTSVIDYVANAESVTSTNPNLVNVRYAVAGSVPHYNDSGAVDAATSVLAGDPLLQRRFSLARIAWLQHKEENPGDDSLDAAIQSAFGLQWISASDHWNYVGSTGSATQSSIETLAQVAAETPPREPNFVELLKAGILSGSIGLGVSKTAYEGTMSEDYVYNPGAYFVDTDSDLQILRIAADIIDCAETDNYPTILTLLYEGIPFEVAGVSDLPYLYGINVNSFFTKTDPTVDPPNGKVTQADEVFVPIFIMPHRSSDTAATSGPAQVQLDICSGSVINAYFAGGGNYYSQEFPVKELTILPSITISSAQFDSFRTGPQPQTASNAPNSLGNLVPYVDASLATVLGFNFFSFQNDGTGPGPFPFPVPSDPGAISGIGMTNVTFRLRYQTRDGSMKTYATFGGYESLPLTTGLSNIGYGGNILYGPSQTAFDASYFLSGVDPRTNRLGPGLGWIRPLLGPVLPLQSTTIPGYAEIQDNIGQQIGFPMLPSGVASYLGYWPQGGKTSTLPAPGAPSDPSGLSIVNSTDPDSQGGAVLRPNDGWLGTSANPYVQAEDTVHLNPTSPSRPVLLHRPYRSVAELGYVFRDTQWKTLSFFDETSADSALLDLFSVSDEPPLTAGRVNLNTRQPATLAAILSGAAQNPDGSNPLAAPAQIATAYSNYAFSAGVPTATLPLNVASLANFMSSAGVTALALDNIKYRREAVVRALGNSAQTRTWNLLIDLVAQTGRYPASAQSADDFLVEGEKHYWLSVAIDRYTDKIVQEQLESADE
jgi:hypothetical protein